MRSLNQPLWSVALDRTPNFGELTRAERDEKLHHFIDEVRIAQLDETVQLYLHDHLLSVNGSRPKSFSSQPH